MQRELVQKDYQSLSQMALISSCPEYQRSFALEARIVKLTMSFQIRQLTKSAILSNCDKKLEFADIQLQEGHLEEFSASDQKAYKQHLNVHLRKQD